MVKPSILLSAVVTFATFTAFAESPLEKAVLAAVRDAHFERVIDFGPANEDKDIPKGSTKHSRTPPRDHIHARHHAAMRSAMTVAGSRAVSAYSALWLGKPCKNALALTGS